MEKAFLAQRYIPYDLLIPSIYIALGSNIDPDYNLRAAADALRSAWPTVRFSPVYRTAPVGFADQQDFLNAVAHIDTDQPTKDIHHILQTIEHDLHKATPFPNGPRTIDLDLLLYGNAKIDTPDLHVPHPRMHTRRFVLQPLIDLEPTIDRHPTLRQPWQILLDNVRQQEIAPTDITL